MGVKIQLFDVGAYRSDFCLWGWMKSEVYKEKANTRDELVARIMKSAALIKQECQDDLRRATRTIAKRVERCCYNPLHVHVSSSILPILRRSGALKSMVGSLNTYFELLQFIEIIYISNKCNQ